MGLDLCCFLGVQNRYYTYENSHSPSLSDIVDSIAFQRQTEIEASMSGSQMSTSWRRGSSSNFGCSSETIYSLP